MCKEERNMSQKAKKPCQVMIFRIGQQIYALPVMAIREICRITKLTPIPHAAPYVLGATNLRGEIPVIIDLAHILAVEKEEGNKRQVSIMFEQGTFLTGLVVDEVLQMKEIDLLEVAAAEVGVFLKGTIVVKESIIGFLDIDAIVKSIREQA